MQQLNNIALGTPSSVSNWNTSITHTLRALAQQHQDLNNTLSPQAQQVANNPTPSQADIDTLTPDEIQTISSMHQILHTMQQYTAQRDYVLAAASYNAYVKGLRDQVEPQATAMRNRIQQQAHQQSPQYTIQVEHNGRTGYLIGGDINTTTLPDGTLYTHDPQGTIYTILFHNNDNSTTTRQLTPDQFTILNTTNTQDRLDEELNRIYTPIEQQLGNEQQQAQSQLSQTPQNEQTISPSAEQSEDRGSAVGEGVSDIGEVAESRRGSETPLVRDTQSLPSEVNISSSVSRSDIGEVSRSDGGVNSEGIENIEAIPGNTTPIDPATLDDQQFNTHIGTLPVDQAINAITARRGAQEADQYATWRRAILTRELTKAQKTLNAKPKPFDPSRYTDYAQMKSEERKYNDAIQATRTQAQQTIQQLSNEIATIDGYLADRNRQIAAEREAQREAENPLRNGITQAVERQPINTLDQYIARHIALGGRLRMTDQYTNGLARELGITPGSAEHRELLSILSNNDGMTPEQLAHHISENIEPEYRHLIAGRDTQDIRNTIIDTIAGGVTSRRRAYQYIADINNQASATEQRYYEQQELQAHIDADTEASIRRYEEQLLSSLTQEDLAAIDAMAGDYIDELIAIQQYEQEAYDTLNNPIQQQTISPSAEQSEDRGSAVGEGVSEIGEVPEGGRGSETPLVRDTQSLPSEVNISSSVLSPSASRSEDRGSGRQTEGVKNIGEVPSGEGVNNNNYNNNYNNDTTTTTTTPPHAQQRAESPAIQPSTTTSQGTTITQDSHHATTSRPATPQPSGDSTTTHNVVEQQPIGMGEFGPIYDQFRGKTQEAIAFLSKKQNGEAIAALNHPEIGDIDLVWGETGTSKSDGFGLAKLVKYHPEVLSNLQEIINDMHVTQRSANRVQLESNTHQAAVRLTWNDKKKNWLLTAFEKKNSAFDNTTDTGETSNRGKQNDTTTLQNTVSTHKDSERRENNKTSSPNFSSEPNPILSKDTTSSPNSNELNPKIAEAESRDVPPVRPEINNRAQKLDHIARWQQTLAVPIVILHDISQVGDPQALAQIAQGMLTGSRTPGWITDGTVYLYLPHCTNQADIDQTIMHECIAHYGIARLFRNPETAQAFYDKVWQSMSLADRRKFINYPGVSHLTGSDAQRAAADEYIAHLAEKLQTSATHVGTVSTRRDAPLVRENTNQGQEGNTNITSSIRNAWNNIVTHLRNTLIKAGVNLRINDADLNHLLLQSLNQLRKNKQQPISPTSVSAPASANEIGEVAQSAEGVSEMVNLSSSAISPSATNAEAVATHVGTVASKREQSKLVQSLPSESNLDNELDIFLREQRTANERHREYSKTRPQPRNLVAAYEANDTNAIQAWEKAWDTFLQQLIPMDIPVIDGTIISASRNKAVKMVQTPRGYKTDKNSAPYKAFDYIERTLKKRKQQLERNLTDEQKQTIDIVKRGIRGDLQQDTRLRAVSQAFDKQLQQQIDGTLPVGHVYNLGMPSPILRSAGLPNLPIQLAASRLSDKSIQDNHPFDIAEVRGLVDAIQHPIAVFRSATHVGSFVALTEIQHNERNFVVAIEANSRKGRIEVNSIRSVYPKNNTQVANWIIEDLLEYANKEKMSEWFSKQQSNSADVRKLFRHSTKIVQNFENPKLPDTRLRFIGEQGATNLDQAQEATTRLDNLAVARSMEQAGRDAHTIKLATGWERGADNLWRYEMPDAPINQNALLVTHNSGAKITILSSLIDDEQLFKAYPQLYDMVVAFQQLPLGELGNYSPRNAMGMPANIILSEDFLSRRENPQWREEVNRMEQQPIIKQWADAMETEPFDMQAFEDADRKFKESPLYEEYNTLLEGKGKYPRMITVIDGESTLAHEVQHAIQDIEGFARGGNERTADALQDKARAWAWRNALIETAKEHPELAGTTAIEKLLIDEYTQDGLQQYIPTDEQRIKGFNLYVRGYDNEGYENAWEQMSKIRPGDSHGTYRRLAGEVEARNVSRRLNLTPEERRNTLATETEDVARQDQIFLIENLGNNPSISSQGIQVSPDEYAKIAHQIATYPHKVEQGHVFTDNNYYLCTNIDQEGNFTIIAQLPIEGNEELIRDIRQGLSMDTVIPIHGRESITPFITAVKRRGGRTYRNIPSSQRQARVDGPNDNLHLGQQPNSSTNQQPLDRDDNSATRFRVANNNQAIFISNARQAVENIRQDKATPEQWLAMLQKNGGIKAGEERWLGLTDWLQSISSSVLSHSASRSEDRGSGRQTEGVKNIGEVSRSDEGVNSQKGSKTITRQQILDFINSNAIHIQEVHYSQFGTALIDQATRILEAQMLLYGWDALQRKYPGIEELFERDGQELLWSENLADIGEYEDFIIDNQIVDINPAHNAINETREQYTTPGLESNHEIALTIPGIEPYNTHDHIHFGDAGSGRAIAWIRFGETTDVHGNPILVIDEIQSKRHQDGREKGYRDSLAYNQALAQLREREPIISRRLSEISDRLADISDLIPFDIKGIDARNQYRRSLPQYPEWEALQKERNMLRDELHQLEHTVRELKNEKVPDAPFDKNWHELAFKRMLRYAAENGYQHLAWTTGTQQAERYDIGNNVNAINRDETGALVETPQGDISIDFTPDGNITTGQYQGNTLAEVFGKETAVKILNMTPGQTISGDNLHIGGQGMKTFYDHILPSFVSKYVKKWGSKVQDITLPQLGNNGLTMHSVEITPDMQQSVMQGQTMFRSISSNQSLPQHIKQRFSFRELNDETFSSPASTSAIGEVPQGEGVKELSSTPEEKNNIDRIARTTTPILRSQGTFRNLAEAEEWAKRNLQGRSAVNIYTGERIEISRKSVSEMLNEKTLNNSASISSHLAALRSVLHFIQTGIPAEIHPDTHNRGFNVMRLYNAINIDGNIYRVKSTVRKVNQGDKYYTYEVQEMELIEEREAGSNREGETPHNGNTSNNSIITGAKLLKGAKKTNSDQYILPPDTPIPPTRYTPELIEQKTTEINNLLRQKGFLTSISRSTAHGKSNYINVSSPSDYRSLAKIRISDHSITSSQRLLNEYHVQPWQSAQDVISDLFNDYDGTRFRTISPSARRDRGSAVGEGVREKVKNTNDPIHTAQQVVADNMPRRIDERTRQLADKLQVPITVIHNNDQLRPLGHDYNELADWLDGKIDGRTHRTVGMFDSRTNRLFVFAHTLQTTKDPIAELERTITHEVVAHYGLRQLLGEENLATFLSDVWNTMNPMRQQRWAKYALNKPREHSLTPQEMATIYSNPAIQRKAAEEYIAHLSEEGVSNPTLWQHICAAFRRILRRIGIFSYAPTNADIRYTLALSYRNLTSSSVLSPSARRDRGSGRQTEGVKNIGEVPQGEGVEKIGSETGAFAPEGLKQTSEEATTRLRFIGEQGATNLDQAQEATNTLDAIDETTRQYQASLDDIRQDIIHATTPQPGDTPLTIAEKIHFRSVVDGEFLNRDNSTLQELMALTNKITTAMSENDKKHRFTGLAEAHYDSMQRLSNLLQDIKENGGIFDEDYDPWITQNQAASRAQSSMNVFNITYRQPLFAAIRQCILAAFPGINTTDKAKVDDAYYRLSLYVQARTAVERQHVKSEQAKAEATEKGEEYQERDFAGLAGVQYAIFGVYKAIDDTVEKNQHNHEKLSAYAQEIGIPTIEEYIQDIEEKIGVPAISAPASASEIGEVVRSTEGVSEDRGGGAFAPEGLNNSAEGNNNNPADQLWNAIQDISKFQLATSYLSGITSRAGYQTLTYGTNIDAILRARYEQQKKAITDNPGSYVSAPASDNEIGEVSHSDEGVRGNKDRKQLNSSAIQALATLKQEYAQAIRAIPMPDNVETVADNPFTPLISSGWLTEDEVNSFHRYYEFYTPLKGHAELTSEDIVEYNKKTPHNQSKIKTVEGHTQLARDNLQYHNSLDSGWWWVCYCCSFIFLR